MAKEDPVKALEADIQLYYEKYSAKRVALAAFLVGVFTIGSTYVAYAVTTMELLAILVFGLVGVIAVYLTMIFVVPPSRRLAEARQLICSAVREPTRIRSADSEGVQLADDAGAAHLLTGPDLEVWKTRVVPHFMRVQASVQPAARARTERKYTVSERKYIEDRRKEVLEIEQRIEEERKRIDQERKDIEKRSAELRKLEKTLSEKRAEVERQSEPEPKPTDGAGQS